MGGDHLVNSLLPRSSHYPIHHQECLVGTGLMACPISNARWRHWDITRQAVSNRPLGVWPGNGSPQPQVLFNPWIRYMPVSYVFSMGGTRLQRWTSIKLLPYFCSLVCCVENTMTPVKPDGHAQHGQQASVGIVRLWDLQPHRLTETYSQTCCE